LEAAQTIQQVEVMLLLVAAHLILQAELEHLLALVIAALLLAHILLYCLVKELAQEE
jgi:hypothetical protein